MINGGSAPRDTDIAAITLWLPFPPSVNGLFAHGMVKGKVRRFPTKQYKAWRKEAVIRIRSQRLAQFAEPVVVKIELTPCDGRARDADNYCKPILDALVEARLLADDSNRYVRAVIPYWADPSREHQGARITIRVAGIGGLFASPPGEAAMTP